MQTLFIDIARIGVGLVVLVTVMLGFKMRPYLFELMAQKKVSNPWLYFIGATIVKSLTALGLIFNIYTFWSAVLLATYIFIGNFVFNNFWAVPKEQRDAVISMFVTSLALSLSLFAIAAAY